MLNIGCHLSKSKGYANMGRVAVSIGANTFQCFSRNPRGISAQKISKDDICEFQKIAKKNNFTKFLTHAPYTLNACSKNPKIRELSYEIMSSDISILEEYLPNNLYNFHPGSHGGQGVDVGIRFTSDLLNNLLKESQSTIVLIETMAGRKNELCGSLEEIKMIIDHVNFKDKIGVCLDTCHIFSAGYDIVNDLDGVLEKIDTIIGLKKIYAIHLNDSSTPFFSRKDGHERLGKGSIGLETISRIINHEKLKNIPFFLETPNDLSGYAEEIKLVKSIYNGD